MTPPVYGVRRASVADLPLLPAIELAAAQLLRGFAPESVLAESTSIADFESARVNDLLWVASAGDEPVGFARVKRLEPGAAHLDELDVHPDHGRRGLGRRLVTAVCDWAAIDGLEAVTLSTFREPRWNQPFYASLGFDEVEANALSDALLRIVEDETRRGLDPARRVVMRRPLAARSTS